jgi:hypothetical protein
VTRVPLSVISGIYVNSHIFESNDIIHTAVPFQVSLKEVVAHATKSSLANISNTTDVHTKTVAKSPLAKGVQGFGSTQLCTPSSSQSACTSFSLHACEQIAFIKPST